MFLCLVYLLAMVILLYSKCDAKINEDAIFLQKSIKLFGPPRLPNYENISLPGLELNLHNKTFPDENIFSSESGKNYTIKLRAASDSFSYNDLYEFAKVEKVENEVTVTIMGQFTEKIPRKEGGYYLRTIGYIKDENGYRRFLIDISKIMTTKVQKVKPQLRTFGYGCGKRRRRSPISPCALASLVGR